MRTSTPLPLSECRVRASLLLKALHGPDAARAREAALRLRTLPGFASVPLEQLLQHREDVQRKHALACIAHEQGFASWAQLKAAREAEAPALDTRTLFRGNLHGFLNRWFSSYEEARASLQAAPGMLFPYGPRQFVVCEPGFVRALGLDPSDPDWERIGHDWARPKDPAARARLEQRLRQLGYGEVAHG
ncbi:MULTISPECIES: hypothetical protein [Myxococcaceae]|uniref:hypothetical protein n=1 Tax=Myxococcaceae TaxID=31 RepID=UPI001E5ADBEF|nr:MULTISPECIES: hypothetical protein [Myxococcaceae]